MGDLSEKAVKQFTLRCNGVLGETFGNYGQGVHVPQATEAILQIALDMHNLMMEEITPDIVAKAVLATKYEVQEALTELIALHKLEAEQADKDNEIQPD